MRRRGLAGGYGFLLAILFVALSKHMSLIFITLIFAVVAFFLWKALQNYLYKVGINNTQKQYIFGDNTLRNERCMVKYFPNNRIVATDTKTNSNGKKCAFTLSKYDVKNLNDCWKSIYGFFNSYTDSIILANYLESFYCENSIEMQVISQEQPKIQQQQPVSIAPVKVINVNKADAQELSNLPGINIVCAKKIVDYRNKNGEFSTEEEFFKVSGVKDFFYKKISSMIVIEKSMTKSSDDENNIDGRIVDF